MESTPLDLLKVWAIPIFVALILLARIALRLLLFPLRIIFWLSVPLLIAWVLWNWSWLGPMIFSTTPAVN